jgi:outer membrane protein insertion porin family
VELPNGGQRTELRTELAGPFGGEVDFYKVELRSFWYFPGFFAKHVIETGGEIGVVDSWGRSTKPPAGVPDVPLFDRYFLGGISSLRGYKYRDVGPHALDGEPIGGKTMWFGTFEYSMPIVPTLERLRFAVFYDIGNVYRDAYSFTATGAQRFYNDNWGVGIRLNIPRLGPLRLDYGIPITHDRDSGGTGRFQFSVGFRRNY